MIPLSLPDIAGIVGGSLAGSGGEARAVAIDSRRCRPGDLFFALQGRHADGQGFAADALSRGAAGVVVRAGYSGPGPAIEVADPTAALHRLAAWYRRQHIRSALAITGSNGKTIVKDALVALLAGRAGVAASPGSFNSQVGVPLAVLAAPPGTEIGIFEAGISAPGEMERLREILQPDHGLLTNIGLAHLAAFGDRAALAREKMALFAETAGWILLPEGEPLIEPLLPGLRGRALRRGDPGLPRLLRSEPTAEGTWITVGFPSGDRYVIPLRVRSPALIEDLVAAMAAAHLLGEPTDRIAALAEHFSPGPTRMEIWRAPEGVTLINDAHSADPLSVQAALSAAAAEDCRGKRIFVFGGMGELGERSPSEHALIGKMAAEKGFSRLILLESPDTARTAAAFLAARPSGAVEQVLDTAALQPAVRAAAQAGDVVLVKGPRQVELASVARAIWESMAPRRLIVDLEAIAENLDRFRRIRFARSFHSGPKVLVMLKAWGYGTDPAQVATWLQERGVDWIGVSAADEGAQVRRAGVSLPVLVTLLDAGEADKALRYRLTPAVYSPELADALAAAARRAGAELDVHLKVDTGMGRLGVQPGRAVELAQRIRDTGVLRLTGVMTHLSSADDPAADDYTREQLRVFDASIADLAAAGFDGLLRHAAATAGAVRFPEAGYDLIRVGLGLYGVYTSPAIEEALPLRLAVSLIGRISHVAALRRGQRVGYSGTYTVTADEQRVGIVGMGYNDGIPWRLSNRGYALIRGKEARFLGRVSMDSLAIDLSGHPTDVGLGEEVLFFGSYEGHELRPEAVAELAGTIPYELLVKVDSRRVQRLFVSG